MSDILLCAWASLEARSLHENIRMGVFILGLVTIIYYSQSTFSWALYNKVFF